MTSGDVHCSTFLGVKRHLPALFPACKAVESCCRGLFVNEIFVVDHVICKESAGRSQSH